MSFDEPLLVYDFDGVLNQYTSGWQGMGVIADGPVPGALEHLLGAMETFRVAIFSSRSKNLSGRWAMKRWLRHHLAEHYCSHRELWGMEAIGDPLETVAREWAGRITRRISWPWFKPPALITIDDRALTFDGTWPSIATLKAFQPWNKKPQVERSPNEWMDGARTFIRVYKLPTKLTDGYCFGAGMPITFQNVDWFETMDSTGQAGLTEFIRTKRYFDPRARFLVIGDKPEFTYTIEPEVA